MIGNQNQMNPKKDKPISKLVRRKEDGDGPSLGPEPVCSPVLETQEGEARPGLVCENVCVINARQVSARGHNKR